MGVEDPSVYLSAGEISVGAHHSRTKHDSAGIVPYFGRENFFEAVFRFVTRYH